LLGINDRALALDLDITSAVSLEELEDKRQQAFAALIASYLAQIMVGGTPPTEFEEMLPKFN
jgi:hypothetical protein